MIIMPCKYDATRPVVQRAVQTARQFLPSERVCVVDSNSSDKSYFDDVRSIGAEVLDIGNLNYDTGAYWSAIKKYPDEEFYFLIHDSCYFTGTPPAQLYEEPATAFVTLWNDTPQWKYAFGPEMDWARNQLSQTDIQYLDTNFWMVLGPILFIQRETIRKLIELRFDHILPDTKIPAAGATERLWGIALKQIGIDPIPSLHPWVDNHRQFEYSINPNGLIAGWFAKTWLFRDHPV